ncbi:hypothetical protein [Nitrobacter sp.]|uniref:hypothetical protein n=1 Tax=Nitrobacter sp. TaxID=29420 RepID=UPI0029CABA8F|nr:hypothetical protein [Nitrobacter sp.]
MDNSDLTRKQLAMGVAGFAISQALMEAMRDADVLPVERLADVMYLALEKVESDDRRYPTEVSRLARELLEGLHKSWSPPPFRTGNQT